jgi:heme oxygenase
MAMMDIDPSLDLSRAKRLRAATHAAHERLDQRIMASEPFASRERYGVFVQVQYLFHREIDALYGKAELQVLLPDLAQRRRLGLIEQDLADLVAALPKREAAATFDAAIPTDIPTALGWLYVAEGSTLGAAFLLKEAAKLGLDENFGARHLAAAPEGRGLHWRRVTVALDAVALSADEDARAIAGANDAFAFVRSLVDRFLPISLQAVAPNSHQPA